MGKFFKVLSWIVLILTLFCYSAALIPPEKFWPAGILVYGILPFLLINFILFVVFLVFIKRAALIPLFGLLAGFLFIKITFHFNSSTRIFEGKKIIEILSYNVKAFEKARKDDENLIEMINWLIADSSEIKCIQEFYSNSYTPDRDVIGKMKENGYDFHILSAENGNRKEYEGLAIFTRYPIINKGTLLFRQNSGNNCIYSDLKIDKDTLRIYNVHLYSMRIPLYAYRNPNNYESKLKSLIRKLRNGAINRSNEIDQLIRHTAGCPYPYVICGDFNDIPYSYNYLKLRKNFTNAFEEVGQGFGFSFNNRLFFLRIDHQFVGNRIHPVSYRVDRRMKKSDHFPTRGIYQLP